MQAVKRAHNILNLDKDKIAKDFAPDKKVSLHVLVSQASSPSGLCELTTG